MDQARRRLHLPNGAYAGDVGSAESKAQTIIVLLRGLVRRRPTPLPGREREESDLVDRGKEIWAVHARDHILRRGSAVPRKAIGEVLGEWIGVIWVAVVEQVPDGQDLAVIYRVKHRINGREVV